MSAVTLTLALLSSGCAATNSAPSKVAGAAYPGDTPAPSAVARSTAVEMEADGLPAQVSPRNRRPMKDEPTEPWSPNYGTARSDVTEATPMTTRVASTVPVRSTAAEPATPRLAPDDIVRLAIAEHEMQRR